MTGQQNIN